MERKRAHPDQAAQAKALYARQQRERNRSIRETEALHCMELKTNFVFLIMILKLIMLGKWIRYTMQHV